MERRAAQRHTIPDVVAPLFVPGDRVDRAVKALERGTRSVVLDLEDAVAPARKPDAREQVVSFLASVDTPATVSVRVNSELDLLRDDVAALGPHLQKLDAVVLAKTETSDQVGHLMRAIDDVGHRSRSRPSSPWVLPTIETAAGLEAAPAIAATVGVFTLLFGPADLSADLGTSASADGLELLMARSRVVHTCALARTAGPIDGAYLMLDDEPGLEISARHARRLGFLGKAVIHPQQLSTVQQVFAPDPAEVEWATRVLEAYERSVAHGVGAMRLEDGTFIDEAVTRRARAIRRSVRDGDGVGG